MIASLDPANGPSSWNDDGFARTLRLDLEDEERRALIGSYAISGALGLAFLLLQQFGPRSDRVLSLLPDRPPPIVVQDFSGVKEPTLIPRVINAAIERAGFRRDAGASSRDGSRVERPSGEAAIGNAFGAPGGASGVLVGDASGLLRDVAVASGAGDVRSGSDAKHVLAYGEGGTGSALPRGAGLGGGNSAAIGGVRGSGGVGRVAVAVAALEVRPLDPPPGSGGAATALGTWVRGQESALRFCYEESLRGDPALAGSVTVAITLAASGAVSNAEVTRRSWSGKGAAEAEACMLRTIRGWRFPEGGRSGGTYAFPFSFTR